MSRSGTRSAVVTGASSGIGAAIAERLAASGYRLGLIGRDAGRLGEVAEACGKAGASGCVTGAFDIRDAEAFRGFVAEFGSIDLYVSNAGILDGRRGDEAIETRDAAITVLEINLMACIEGIHAVLPGMRDRRGGQIVLVTSLAALSPLADAPAYSASKAGLLSYGIGLRDALAGEGIGVTVACPGYVATRMAGQQLGERPFEISADDAARRILRAAAHNKGLCGFPFPLYPAAHLSLIVGDRLRRLFTGGIRFRVQDR